MAFGELAAKAAAVVVTGVTGAVALEGAKKVLRGPVLRGAAVTATEWGLRGLRAAETGAERARLAGADIVSEARERIGEQAPPPGGSSADHGDHQH